MTEALTTAQRLRAYALTGADEIVLTLTPAQAREMADALDRADAETAAHGMRLHNLEWRVDRWEREVLERSRWWFVALLLGWLAMVFAA
jgi:uncharacterized protein YchJ